MFFHQRPRLSEREPARAKNKRGLLFYFFCYQFMMSPISLAGYVLEATRARRAW